MVREQEDLIKKDLKKYKFTDEEEKLNILIKHLAATQLALNFEKIEKAIWGSQVDLLRHLNSLPSGASAEELRLFYDAAAKKHPQTFSEYNFEKYLEYLVLKVLIGYEDGRYHITNLGRDFLSYLVATGQSGFRSP